LLKAIYRSHNIYCIHIDQKSDKTFKKAIESIVDCFENVFIVSKQENIVYAGFSRLKADLNCMNDLVHSPKKSFLKNDLKKKYFKWKYLINMAR
jgi:hypothetical protein